MELSEHYKDNAIKANKWIKDNAPHYVIECVEELGHHAIMNGRASLEWHQAALAWKKASEGWQLLYELESRLTWWQRITRSCIELGRRYLTLNETRETATARSNRAERTNKTEFKA